MEEYELFFELIRVSIGTQDDLSRTPSAGEWDDLFAMARKQSLVGICFAGVRRLKHQAPPKMLLLKWMGLAAKIQQRNEIVNRHCAEVQRRIEADGFRSYIMKGQSIGTLYGELSPLRQSGDIDVYLEGGLDRVLAYANTFGPTTKVNELEMHVDFFGAASRRGQFNPEEYTEVEFHYRPFIMRNPFRNARLQRFFQEQSEACFANKITLYALATAATDEAAPLTIATPTTQFNLVHSMVHIYHHLFTEGIGLRQLMDYYFILLSVPSVDVGHRAIVHLSNEVDPVLSLPLSVISELGLNRFASALMWVLQHVYGLDNARMPWTANQRDGEFLLNEIMLSGNFGNQDVRQKALSKSKWHSFWIVNMKSLRLARFDRWMWFWGPFWRLYHYCWRRSKGFE